MRKAVYPGSFDPVTFGHLDIIRRSAALVDELVVGVLTNSAKTPLFSAEERVNILKDVTKDISNVRIMAFNGLSVEFAKSCGAQFMVRGLRAITDFDYELQMSQTNRILQSGIDTIFLSTSLEYAYLSSTTVKEIASYHGDISKFVPEEVIDRIYIKIGEKKSKKNKE
ncbi:MAG: pantetheine-phosphate adenylyltransferase [Firmicutes bacterium]|nr:pantetheine-phosphate adenylyltransferase [Lachnospiraceae bacterium]MDD6065179.1 pantetheine-phosphate adenylyltransferase [Bacillota bacterium]MDY2820129.1 pantetheine-phosphate adenylyltransferase [Hominisplanchenecus sp.]